MEIVLVAAVPAAHRAAGERQVRVLHDALRIEELLDPEPIARGAGAGGVVEGEQLRLERRHAVAAHRTGVAAREDERLALLAVEKDELSESTRDTQRGLEGLRQALRGVGSHAHAVNDRLDRVLFLAIELRQRVELVDASVDTHAYEALRA